MFKLSVLCRRFGYLGLTSGLALGLASCVSVRQMQAVLGNPAYSLDCSGRSLDWSDCAAKAAEVCKGQRVKVLDRSDGSGRDVDANEQRFLNFYKYDRQMQITCGD